MKDTFYQKYAEKKLSKGWTLEKVCESLYAFQDRYNERKVYIVEYLGKVNGEWLYREEIVYLEVGGYILDQRAND